MTTPLHKSVARKSNGNGPNRRRFVITIEPGDVIGFRDERRRKTYYLSLAGCYEMAIKAEVAAKRREKSKGKPRKVARV